VIPIILYLNNSSQLFSGWLLCYFVPVPHAAPARIGR